MNAVLMINRIIARARQGTLKVGVVNALKAKPVPELIIQNKINAACNEPYSKAIRLVGKAFHMNLRFPFPRFRGLPEGYQQLFIQYLVKRRKGCEINSDEYAEFIQQIEALNSNILTTEYWKLLSYLSTYNGLFILGNTMRNKAIECAYNQINTPQPKLNDYLDAFNAAMDQGDYTIGYSILTKMQQTFKTAEIESYWLYYYLLTGNTERALKIAKSTYSDKDRQYANYLEGKTVAVVGPAPSNEDLGSEIDSYDVVIQLNYLGYKKMPPTKSHGSKVNVSYYAGIGEPYYKNDFSFIQELDFGVFKDNINKMNEFDRNKYNPIPKTLLELQNTRVLFNAYKYWFNGTHGPNMIQATIFDLLHFHPYRIKVFNTNFYVGGHFGNYFDIIPWSRPTPKNGFRGFAVHDLISQLRFTRQLWKSNIIDIDTSCEKVLCMSDDKYLALMEHIHV